MKFSLIWEWKSWNKKGETPRGNLRAAIWHKNEPFPGFYWYTMKLFTSPLHPPSPPRQSFIFYKSKNFHIDPQEYLPISHEPFKCLPQKKRMVWQTGRKIRQLTIFEAAIGSIARRVKRGGGRDWQTHSSDKLIAFITLNSFDSWTFELADYSRVKVVGCQLFLSTSN